MKFHILTFGCQMNYADSARIRAVLQHCGFLYEEDIHKADIVIFDTCSVRQKSEDKITGKMKTIRPDQKIWITGCMIQHNLNKGKGNFLGSGAESINTAFDPMFSRFKKKHKNLELFWRIDDTGFLPMILEKLGYDVAYEGEFVNEYEKIIPESITSMNMHASTAYVPISTGCSQFCAYCIVPYARGLEKYFPVDQIVKEAGIHLDRGVKEIVLLGQIVNKHPQFIEILKSVLKLKGLKWLRYTSPYPSYYSAELLQLHEKEEKLCPHIHIPLQSGSDAVLKRMFRGYTLADAKKFIDNIRALKRDISITTDIIVGFPGESEGDFQKTLELVEYGNFDMIYMGIYSTRPGTLAQKKYTDDVPREVKRERRNKLNQLLKRISKENNIKEVGKIHEMLVNEKTLSQLNGYTENMKQISVEMSGVLPIEIGDFVNVKIIKGTAFKLYGTVDF